MEQLRKAQQLKMNGSYFLNPNSSLHMTFNLQATFFKNINEHSHLSLFQIQEIKSGGNFDSQPMSFF